MAANALSTFWHVVQTFLIHYLRSFESDVCVTLLLFLYLKKFILQCTLVPVVNFKDYFHKIRCGFCCYGATCLRLARLRVKMRADGRLWLRSVYPTYVSSIVNLKGRCYSEVVLLLTCTFKVMLSRCVVLLQLCWISSHQQVSRVRTSLWGSGES